MKGFRNALIDYLSSKLPEGQLPPPPGMTNEMLTDPGTYQGAGQRALNFLIPQPEDTLIAPAELRPNFRSPEQIQALRRIMAEEQRARGPINNILSNEADFNAGLPIAPKAIRYENKIYIAKGEETHAPAIIQLAKDIGKENFDQNKLEIGNVLPNGKFITSGEFNSGKYGIYQDNIGGVDKQLSDRYRSQAQNPDPIDQILRGSWYHGMSEKARRKIGTSPIDKNTVDSLQEILSGDHKALTDLIYDNKPFVDKLTNLMGYSNTSDFVMKLHKQGLNPKSVPEIAKPLFDELIKTPKAMTFIEDNLGLNPLTQGLDSGFPLSAHDAQSISNKLGEPAGVSLSLNPTVSGKFSADPNIFRVMPLYGGPPIERTVNLMTKEGRNALNDAYDVVANSYLAKLDPWDLRHDAIRSTITGEPYNYIQTYISRKLGTGQFNQQLSNQLQNQGYRHILYNPQRWNEYEMLALDPKYALPLDYRNIDDYTRDLWTYGIRHKQNFLPEHAGTPTSKITPQAAEGINQIGDLMSQNASRLGDIYSERSWWDRLSDPVKNYLLQDNPKAEAIIRKLKGEVETPKSESLFGLFNVPAGQL